jgi:Kef-type K+ transport system membrane component KefB
MEFLSSLPGIPSLPPEFDAYARIALLLIGAIALAELGDRLFRLPRLIGYVVAGILAGPGVWEWVPFSITGDYRQLMLLGLGLLLFELGSRVDLRWLAHNPLLLVSSLVESTLTFVAVYGFLTYFGFDQATSISVGAIAVSTSPTVIMRVVAEIGARGQMTQRLIMLTALNSLYGILLLKVAVAFVHLRHQTDLLQAIMHPLYIVSGSFLLAVAIAVGIHLARLTRIQRESERFTLVIAVVLLASTAADELGLSVPMALLVGGMILRAQSKRLHLFPVHFGSAGGLLVILLFVLTGVTLEPEQVLAGGMMSLGVLLLRAFAKFCGAWLSSGRSGLSPQKALWFGLALLPMSSLAVLQAYEVATLYPDSGDEIIAIVLGAVLVMELVGPILTQVALRRVGEAMPRQERRHDRSV